MCENIPIAELIYQLDEEPNGTKEVICSETLFWLKDSNIITFIAPTQKTLSVSDVIPNPIFKCTVLTAKGLEILKQTPDSILNKDTLGDKLSKAVEGGAMSKISEVVGLAISGSLKFA